MEQTQSTPHYTKDESLEIENKAHSQTTEYVEQGRIGRRLYFLFAIALPFTAIWALTKIFEAVSQSAGVTSLYLYWILSLVGISIYSIIVRLTVHRCHDFGVSRWYALLALIPFTPLIFVLIPGNDEENTYGAKPKNPISTIKDYFWYSVIKLNNNLKY